MRENVRSKGGFYNGMAAEAEAWTDAGGPVVARAARFLSDATIAAFKAKLTHQQHAVFEFATAMTEVETAVALARAATRTGDALMLAQSRVWSSDIALSVPARVLKVMAAAGTIDQAEFARLSELGSLPLAIGDQAGRMADMDFVARTITAR